MNVAPIRRSDSYAIGQHDPTSWPMRRAMEAPMSDRYYVTAVRKSKGLHTDEGKYPDEAAAIEAELGDDQNCLIAEVTEGFGAPPNPDPKIVIAAVRGSTKNVSALKANC
jgi:hypothetical protein